MSYAFYNSHKVIRKKNKKEKQKMNNQKGLNQKGGSDTEIVFHHKHVLENLILMQVWKRREDSESVNNLKAGKGTLKHENFCAKTYKHTILNFAVLFILSASPVAFSTALEGNDASMDTSAYKSEVFVPVNMAPVSEKVNKGEIKREDLTTEAKIDSIFQMQKKIYAERNISPLNDKKYGVEFNLFRFLAWSEMISLSGGVSLFDINRHAEIAFPFYYGKGDGDHSETEINLDVHYRYFLGNNQKGFYLSGFSRYEYLNYYSYDYQNAPLTSVWDNTYQNHNMNRLGAGIGLGYRIFSEKGLYWGTGLTIGRFFDDGIQGNYPYGSVFSWQTTSPFIIDFELLKFGWAF
jgi:hypothetical protein